MVTLGLLSLAVLLQVIAGLMVILYTDFNPTRHSREEPEERDHFGDVPREAVLSIDTTSTDERRRIFEQNWERAEGKNVRIRQMDPDGFEKIEYPPSPSGDSQDTGPGVFSWWFTRRVRVRRTEDPEDGDFGPWEESRVYSPPWRPFDVPLWQMDAFRRLFRQLSLLLVGVTALVRLAHGEPILKLFFG